MSIFLAHFRGINRVGFAALVIASIGILMSIRASAQISEEEHARHHPGQVTPSAGTSPAQSTGPRMMEGMGEMMRGMHGVPPKQLYPTLMALPTLSAEQRQQVEAQADERIRTGSSLMGQAIDALAQGAASQDYTAMQDATMRLHEGLTQFESGIAAKRALAEGRPPPQVALEWFKREMNLPLGAATAAHQSIGVFHIFTMVLLVAFALAMLVLYFFKMRRAAALFGRIEADKGMPPPGSAPELAGKLPPNDKPPPSDEPPSGGTPPGKPP